jgi:hypothetical protein
VPLEYIKALIRLIKHNASNSVAGKAVIIYRAQERRIRVRTKSGILKEER